MACRDVGPDKGMLVLVLFQDRSAVTAGTYRRHYRVPGLKLYNIEILFSQILMLNNMQLVEVRESIVR